MQATPKVRARREYHCDFGACSNVYRTKYSLKRHYLGHLGVKQHECPYCHKRFSLPQYLQEHLYIHTGEKPFLCTHPGCLKRFRQAGKLSIHKKEHIAGYEPTTVSPLSPRLKSLFGLDAAAQAVHSEIAAFQLPAFFYTKSLPLPAHIPLACGRQKEGPRGSPGSSAPNTDE
jgi:hypothetical protein